MAHGSWCQKHRLWAAGLTEQLVGDGGLGECLIGARPDSIQTKLAVEQGPQRPEGDMGNTAATEPPPVTHKLCNMESQVSEVQDQRHALA